MPLVFFYISWKHQETGGFLMFLECIEKDQWHKVGWHYSALFNVNYGDSWLKENQNFFLY